MNPDRSQFRDVGRYMTAVASELASPLLRSYASRRARRDATKPGEWRRGLILGSGHIGDVLYRTCSLDQLCTGLPDCRWTYLTTPNGAEILHGNPAIADILAHNRETAVDYLPPHSAREIRDRDFDVVLCTDSIKHHEALWLSTTLGIPNRVAFVQKGFSGFATFPVRTPRMSWPAEIRSMVSAVTGTTDTSALRPKVCLSGDDRAAAIREWNSLACPDASMTVVASIASRQTIGVFPGSLFVKILRAVLERVPDARIVLTGAAGELSSLETVAAEIGPSTSVRAGTMSLRALTAFLALCDAFVGADSGPRHLANAAGIPVFFVRNLAVPEIEAGRYCDSEQDIAPPGQYLSTTAATHLLGTLDISAIANAVVVAARRRSVSPPVSPFDI